ncbi:unnamed protein product [Fusarium equiseti]|uniref:Major facilitator superfamily (MFS) profile domain-containing protein n=1 Tax=Fusarium equiseti TaxID=61235 RepID=A0A8J2IZY7_FUSEQ|nr:unnamed protein product [Fusarium equiseti]
MATDIKTTSADTELAFVAATLPDPYLVAFNDLDTDNPKNWPTRRKWAVTNVLSVTGFNRILVSTVMAPALSIIAKDLSMTPTQSVMALSIYLLATAFGPLVIGPLSEVYGRKNILHVSNIWFLVWNVAWPVIGGFMTDRVSWRWMFWSTSLFQVAMAALSFTTFKETYAPAILKQRAKKLRKETGEPYHTYEERSQEGMSVRKVLNQAMTRPLRLLIFHPIIQLTAIISAIGYGLLYIVLTSFAELWTHRYGHSVEISGLHYISCALGELIGSQLGAPLMDYFFRRMERRSVQHYPEHRVPLMLMFAFVAPIGFIIYGWCAQFKVHWIWVDVAMCITMFGMQISAMPLQAYMMDSYPDHTSSAIAAQQFPRSLAAFLFPLFTPKMYAALGYGWGNSAMALAELGLGVAAPSTRMASTQESLASKDDGLKIIHAGLYRTGTMSMTEAYRILGYNPHHARDNLYTIPWELVENAAEATWPHITSLSNYSYRGPDGKPIPRPPFTREDWQSLWGEYDVVTDIASTFTLELMKAYPNAKIVVVQRKFGSWWPSFKSELLQSLLDVNFIQGFIIRHIMRLRAVDAMIKIHTGFFGVNEFSMAAIEPRAGDVYEEYYSKVREAAGGRYLEYHLGDGWEPLLSALQ